MAIEKSAAATAPLLQPWLQPKTAAPRGFEAALSAALGEPPPVSALPPKIERRAPWPGSGEVSGRISDEVRGGIARPPRQASPAHAAGLALGGGTPGAPVEAVPVPPPTPDQLTPEEGALLQAWAKTVKPPARPVHHRAKAPALADPPSEVAAEVNADPESLARTAMAQAGKRYTVGGESPRRGFDCSGLTSYVYSKSGLELPRNSREQYRQGTPVARADLRKGDLVFFGKKGVHHVGIYLEDGKFIHAASSKGAVEVSSLDEPVWAKLYAGARRVL